MTDSERLEAYRQASRKTWTEIANTLGVSISMLMSVKKGTRRMGHRTLLALDDAERNLVREEAARNLAYEQVTDVHELHKEIKLLREINSILMDQACGARARAMCAEAERESLKVKLAKVEETLDGLRRAGLAF